MRRTLVATADAVVVAGFAAIVSSPVVIIILYGCGLFRMNSNYFFISCNLFLMWNAAWGAWFPLEIVPFRVFTGELSVLWLICSISMFIKCGDWLQASFYWPIIIMRCNSISKVVNSSALIGVPVSSSSSLLHWWRQNKFTLPDVETPPAFLFGELWRTSGLSLFALSSLFPRLKFDALLSQYFRRLLDSFGHAHLIRS